MNPTPDTQLMTSIAALVTAAAGMLLSGVGGIISQVAPTTSAEAVAPWLQGTGAIAAVGCLIYIARQFANGSIVAQNTAEREREAAERERTLVSLLGEAHAREADFMTFLKEGRKQ